jgi:ribosomal protein L11 methylase PrmA
MREIKNNKLSMISPNKIEKKSLSAIDVFCGIGGLSYGLKKAGIPVVAGIDVDESCQFAFEKNVKGTFIKKDITVIKGQALKKKYWKSKNTINGENLLALNFKVKSKV